eukprot:TRINITY_DN15166_c0_g1_i3.p1 TRINITY_DN15166_c0_g1~~TRINITY_DN15166_c0_g1_i3.p1  ORF type:complete len:452 (-),score=123.31 TRINITY_DN15166_c0_g1_i3:2-1357(-)
MPWLRVHKMNAKLHRFKNFDFSYIIIIMDPALEEFEKIAPEAVAELQQLKDAKLYHQLSQALSALIRAHARSHPAALARAFAGFAAPLVPRLGCGEALAARVARELAGEEGVAFIDGLLPEKKDGDSDELPSVAGPLLLHLERARLALALGRGAEAKAVWDAAEGAVAGWPGCPGDVQAAVARLGAELSASVEDHGQFYHHALRYLSHLDTAGATATATAGATATATDDDPTHLPRLAHALAVAALRASDVFSFGQLLNHPVSRMLTGTDAASGSGSGSGSGGDGAKGCGCGSACGCGWVAEARWLGGMLAVCEVGDRAGFEKLVAEMPRGLAGVIDAAALSSKLSVMSLLALLHSLPASELSAVPMARVMAATGLPTPSACEPLVTTALRLSLLRGTIDACAATLAVRWVRPRILSRTAVQILAGRVGEWETRVESVGKDIVLSGKEVFA